MYAASSGFVANWSDSPSIPIADFVRAGLRRGSDRQALSERIRAGNDVLFYRHFHGPLFHYLLMVVSHPGWSERAVRTAMLAIPCASLAVVYFGCLWLMPGNAGSLTALIAAVLFLSSYSVIFSTELAPHQLFMLCSLVSLILLIKAVTIADRRYWYGAVIGAGLAFCTLEIAFVLVFTLVTCCFVERRLWRADARFAAKSLSLFVATVLAIWPAAILRLSFVKAYAMMAYLALYRGAAWGNAGFAETWRSRVLNSPLEWMLIVMGVLAWIAARKLRVYPIAIFAALMLAATLRVVTETPRYSLAFVPVLDLLAGLALVPSFGPLRRPASFAVVALAVAGPYGEAWYQVAHQPHNPNPRSAAVLTFIYQNELENKAVLAPQADLPTLHYYFPGMRLRGYFEREPAASDRAGFVPDATLCADSIIPAAKP